MDLKEKKCVSCKSDTQPFNTEEVIYFRKKLSPGWRLIENKKLRKKFPFANFKMGMAFAQKVGMIAEQEDHHPDIGIHYTDVEIELSTHAIGGLTENDFIMAAKIDSL